MTLELPADAESFGAEWDQSGVYVLRYSRPDNLRERAERAFDHLPPWFETFQDAEKVLYVGMSGDVMSRLEDHQNGGPRKTVLTRMDCKPTEIVNIMYHDSPEAADQAEWNTATRVARQTDDDTIVVVNGEVV